jgi:hypothetical protein
LLQALVQVRKNVVRDPNAQVRNVSSFNKIKVSKRDQLCICRKAITQGVAVKFRRSERYDKIKTDVKRWRAKNLC